MCGAAGGSYRSASSESGDKELLHRVRQADPAAFRILVRRHDKYLYRVARGVLGSDDGAEDVVQETFLRAFIGLRGFRGEADLRTWLTRILLNEGRRRRRRQRDTIELGALEAEQKQEKMQNSSFPILVADGDPERAAARSEIGRRLERAIDDLPVAFRVVLVLRDVEGASIQQTAKLLGIRRETVKTRLRRARRRLREILGEQFAAALKDVFPFERPRCDALVSRLLKSARRNASTPRFAGSYAHGSGSPVTNWRSSAGSTAHASFRSFRGAGVEFEGNSHARVSIHGQRAETQR